MGQLSTRAASSSSSLRSTGWIFRWPTNSGFDKFYGFIGGETNQWEPVIFDDVISNFGSAFEPQSSIFTCPVTGVYMFGVNLMTPVNDSAQVHLNIDNERLFNVLADDAFDVYSTGTNFAFVSCSQGQSVWVETNRNRVNQKFHSNRYTTLSAILIST